MKPDIFFVVLTYYPHVHSLLLLLKQLAPYPTILVDNTPGPEFGVEKQLGKKIYSDLKNLVVCTNSENLGYTGGVNKGLKEAMNRNATWCVVLNDDLQLTSNTVEDFCTALLSTPKGLAGAYPRNLDKKRWTTTLMEKIQADTSPDFLSGSFLAIHKEVIETMGFLYDPYFIFYEEVEYCIRAKKYGFPLTPIHISGIVHNESSTFEEKPFLHQYYLARNHLLFVERNAPLTVKLYEIVRFPKTLFEHLLRKESGALLGIYDYFFRTFGPHPKSKEKHV